MVRPKPHVSMLHTRWLPILVAVMMADLNFWYFASTGENHADWAGVALFALFAVYYTLSFGRRRDRFSLIALLGALIALALMALRETGALDFGYVPPYAVFVLFVLAAGAGRRRPPE